MSDTRQKLQWQTCKGTVVTRGIQEPKPLGPPVLEIHLSVHVKAFIIWIFLAWKVNYKLYTIA